MSRIVDKKEFVNVFEKVGFKLIKDVDLKGFFVVMTFKKIKEKVPNAILRTTLIVGFPGETDEDFNELIEFINEVKFDKLGVFKYSPEEGTVGATFEDQIPDEIKSKRYIEVVKAQEKIALE